MKRDAVFGMKALVLAFAMLVTFFMPNKVQAAGNEKLASDQYEMANGYYYVKSLYNGKYLLGNNAGYEAQAADKSEAMTFYMKPADLGVYILYDENSKYLTVNAFNAIVRTTGLGENVMWQIDVQGENSFSIYSLAKKKYVCISGTSLKWKKTVDDTCLFAFEKTTGNNPYPEADVCMSITDENGNAVALEDAMATPQVGERIIGYADTHAHLNHNLGSGQATFNGASFSRLGILDALKDCSATHGSKGAFDLWGKLVDGADGHKTDGYPNFTYWPTSYSTNHNQTYYKWLERSYLAGQRLMVHQCVNNATLGSITNALPPYAGSETNDMKIARTQIQNMYDMQDYIDAQYGGPGKGWFRIVTSATEAREVISEGKMAVFLSMELDTLFDCDKDYIGLYKAGEIDEATLQQYLAGIESQLDEFYDLGIRSVFPVHALNNGFGGCQLYQGEIFSIMNYLNRADFYQPEEAANPRVFYKQPKANLDESITGHQNTIGLTETGEWLIHKLIEKKYVIEIDHMGDKTFNAVLDILWEEKYPGVIASHTRILDMFDPEDQAWEQMDIPRMIKVMQLGGTISPMLWETMDSHQICVADYMNYMIQLSEGGVPTTGVPDYEAYQTYDGPYTVPTIWYNMNEDAADDLILGIPYGSDVNGACMLPYFDNFEGVYEEANYEDGSFAALYEGIYSNVVSNVLFHKQTTGNRTFDVNTGDVAHYGLIPDFIKRMQSRPDIVNMEALFNSAEGYIRMLERMEKYSDTYPSRDEQFWIETDTEYWHDNK